jgi:D-glycero-D-manno-heptose 1,7-bisphosphate phosphatase
MMKKSSTLNKEGSAPEKSLSRSVAQSIQPGESRPAVFLDRDGTIIDEIGYLDDPEKISFYPGAIEAMKELQSAGYLLIVVTNQSGIGRGYFSEETAAAVNFSMFNKLLEQGVVISAAYFCPHHPDADCRCRKPDTLMAERATRDLGVDTAQSWMIGDTARDVIMGAASGLKTALVETGKADKGNLPDGTFRIQDLSKAAAYILERNTV